MPDETDKLIADHLASLPQYVKDAFKAAQPFEKIRKMVTDFHLHLDEGERLEQEVLLVMLGLSSPDTFIDETSKSFGLSDDDSKKLIDRIGAELFMPIRDAMRRYMEEQETETSTSAARTLQQKLSGVPVAGAAPQVPAPVIDISPRVVMSAPKPAVPLTLSSMPRIEVSATPVTPPSTTIPVLKQSPTPAAIVSKPSLSGIEDALTKPQAVASEKIDVGISPAKPTYKVDPYLEPPV